MSKAQDLFVSLFSYDRKDPDECPKEDSRSLFLFVKRTREHGTDKTEESFEVISQRNWYGDHWPTKIAFDLTQICYIENKYTQQSDYKAMDVLSESINMAT